MAGAWDLAEGLANSITFVIEYAIFTFFIYEESMQIINREIMNKIADNKPIDIRLQLRTSFDFVMNSFSRDFNNYGILALYACNAYSSYLFASMMTKEWALLFVGEDRISYSFRRTGLF